MSIVLLLPLVICIANGLGTIVVNDQGPYNSAVERLIGEPIKLCNNMEISFDVIIGDSLSQSWSSPFWIGNSAADRFGCFFVSNEYGFLFEYQITNNLIWPLHASGSSEDRVFNTFLPEVGHPYSIKLVLRNIAESGSYDLFVDDNPKYLPKPPTSGLTQKEAMRVWVGPTFQGIDAGNHEISNIVIKCGLEPETTTTPPTPPPSGECPYPVCETECALDIGFLADESGSINNDEFDLIKQFISRIIRYDINSKSYVSLFEYSSATDFGQYLQFTSMSGNGRENIINTLNNNIIQSKGTTSTGHAIQETLKLFNINNDRPDLLFILTDGDSKDPVCSDILQNEEMIQLINNIEIVLIGIGDEISVDLLSTDEYNCLYDNVVTDVFHVPQFNTNDFNNKEYEIRLKTCKIGTCQSSESQQQMQSVHLQTKIDILYAISTAAVILCFFMMNLFLCFCYKNSHYHHNQTKIIYEKAEIDDDI